MSASTAGETIAQATKAMTAAFEAYARAWERDAAKAAAFMNEGAEKARAKFQQRGASAG